MIFRSKKWVNKVNGHGKYGCIHTKKSTLLQGNDLLTHFLNSSLEPNVHVIFETYPATVFKSFGRAIIADG